MILESPSFIPKNVDMSSKVKKLFQAISEKSLTFSLEIKPSTKPNSGQGLFLSGRVEKGEIVALYQGIAYLPNTMSLMSEFVFKDNDYLIRSGEAIIDGNPLGNSKNVWEMAVSKRKATHFCDSDGKKVESYLPNPIALGQYINHDTHGIDCYEANVVPYSYEFPLDFPINLQAYIPNFYFLPSQEKCLMHGLLFITTRTLENEEIFLNYGFNQANIDRWPDWYKQQNG